MGLKSMRNFFEKGQNSVFKSLIWYINIKNVHVEKLKQFRVHQIHITYNCTFSELSMYI